MSDIESLQDEIQSHLDAVKNRQTLERLRITYLGRRGKITALFGQIKDRGPEERREFGKQLNELKEFAESAVASKLEQLADTEGRGDETFDPTLPGIESPYGTIHPISQVIDEICAIFIGLGFEIVDGREIETEFYNFTALNIPLDHPSRDAFDTFYTTEGHLLRSQTSTVQIRVMEGRKPPLRIVAPGRVYRPDTVDASHCFMFHQIEGLMVDDRTAFSDLKGVIHLFLRKLFGRDIDMRFRPHFFPFTEPSVEVDVRWGDKWLELLGAGEVDPAVLTSVGYNPNRVQGFAFGLGVERIAMLKYGIDDIRLFFDNDLRFLKQF